jgi:hypothetical protein
MKTKYYLWVFLPLIIFSGHARSEWIKFSEDGNGAVYYDPSTVKNFGKGIKRLWTLMDLKTSPSEQPLSHPSSMCEFEYDCVLRRSRSLYCDDYTENMGKGEAHTIIKEPRPWIPIPPGSSRDNLVKKICVERKKIESPRRSPPTTPRTAPQNQTPI